MFSATNTLHVNHQKTSRRGGSSYKACSRNMIFQSHSGKAGSQTRPGYPSNLFPPAEKSLSSWTIVLYFCGSMGHLNMPQGGGHVVTLADEEGRDVIFRGPRSKESGTIWSDFLCPFPSFFAVLSQILQLHLNFSEYLLCTRHYVRHRGYSKEQSERQPLTHWSAQSAGTTNSTHRLTQIINCSYHRCIQGK